MFCTNCGAKLPEGSKFCLECGAKVEYNAPAPSTDDWNEPLETIVEQEPAETAVKRPAISFDWSNVKEESHKKEVPEVHSPWGTTGLSEKELFTEMGAPSEDHSRTMSFIDILKKERDAKAQAADEAARPVTEREEQDGDFSAFEETPSFYVPPLYDDVEGHTVTPFEEEESETPAFEEPVNEVEAPVFEEPEEEIEEIEIPSFNESIFEKEETTPLEEELYHTSSFDGADIRATEDYSDLESNLAAILEAGAGKAVSEEEKVDLFEGVSDDDSVEDMYLKVEDEAPVVEEAEEEPAVEIAEFDRESEDDFGDGAIPEAILDFAPKHGGDDFTLDVEDEEDLDEEELEDLESLYISEEDVQEDNVEDEYEPAVEEPITVEEPVLEEPAPVVEEPETVESEIDALKRRLAELMGEPEEEPEEIVKEEAATIEELFGEPAISEEEPAEEPEEEPEEEVVEEFDEDFEVELKDEEPEEEDGFTMEEVAEEPEENEDEESETPEEPESDAISLEDLEKDLFGDADAEDAEPEATKKIDKFYTLYKKNEEFQKLLDEEYNKLQSEEKVPHVEDFVPVEVVKEEPVAAPKTVEIERPAYQAPVAETPAPAPVPVAEAAAEGDEEQTGGGALTVIAVIVAALLVILLGIILVLNFAPDSAIAMSIDSVIETITSMFSSTGTFNGPFLL